MLEFDVISMYKQLIYYWWFSVEGVFLYFKFDWSHQNKTKILIFRFAVLLKFHILFYVYLKYTLIWVKNMIMILNNLSNFRSSQFKYLPKVNIEVKSCFLRTISIK